MGVLFLSVSSAYAETAEEYYNRGLTYVCQYNLTQAISDFTKAIEMNPKYSTKYYLQRGDAYVKQGNLTQAISDFTKAIERDPLPAEEYYKRGDAYLKQNNYTQAILDFNKAIEIHPYNNANPYYGRGLAYASQGNYTQAIADYTKAIEIKPKYAEVYSARGDAYYMVKEYDKAWVDVYQVERFGLTVNPEFLAKLKKTSGKDQLVVSDYPQEKPNIDARINKMKTVLNLTQQQVDAVRPIIEGCENNFQQILQKYYRLTAPAQATNDVQNLIRLNNEMQREIEQNNEDYHQKLSQVLTPEQMNEWKSYAH